MTMSEKLELLRQESGMSYQRLAETAHVDVAHVYRICKGKRNASRNTVLRMGVAMKLEVEQLDDLLSIGGFITTATP